MTETLTAMVISLVVLGAGVTAFVGFLGGKARNDRQADAQDKVRTAVDRLASQIRNAMSPKENATQQPIESVSAYDLIYLMASNSGSTTNNARGLMHVRYCLNTSTPTNQKLYVQTTAYNSVTQPGYPSVTGGCPSPSWATQTLVATHLVNYNSNPANSQPLFTGVANSGLFTDVDINALVDVDSAKPPSATRLQSSVTLRNLNRAPKAVLSCQLPSSGHVACDASGSTDPDGQTLSYYWYVDNVYQPSQSSYLLDYSWTPPPTSRTFKVTIKDSGGMESSQQCTTSSSCKVP